MQRQCDGALDCEDGSDEKSHLGDDSTEWHQSVYHPNEKDTDKNKLALLGCGMK